MTTLNFPEPNHALGSIAGWLREDAFGFLYWLAFLLVLEPDNVLRAMRSGHELAFDHEALRIVVASLLGASVTPVLLLLTRRFPMLGSGRWRHALIHVVGTTCMAFALIVASCFLAAWLFEGSWRPSLADVRDQLVSNWLLLVYAIFTFTAIAHAILFFKRAGGVKTESPSPQCLVRIPVKTRGRMTFLDVASVDWIETQGNYLALHVGPAIHMIRETSMNFEAQLDANQFVRIHRRVIVAVDRIANLQPVTNGDAILRLVDGRELRASRRYREAIRQKWPGPGQGTR